MSLVQNLPVDNNPVTRQESDLVQMLFEEESKPQPQPQQVKEVSCDQKRLLLHIFQEGLLIVLLFLFFTLPFIDKLCEKYLPFLNNTIIYILRIIIILIVFWLVKTWFI
jgi:hypothetical protein